MIESINVVSEGMSILIDKDESPYILESIDWGSPEISFESFKFPKQIGEKTTSTTIGTRDITVTGYIIGSSLSQIESRKDYLNRLISFDKNVTIYFYDKRISGKPSDIVKYGSDYANNNDVLCKFTFYLTCDDPQFYDLDSSFRDMSVVLPKFYLPFAMSKSGFIFSEKKISKIIEINNTGTNDIGMVITLKANGKVVNPKITDINSQDFFRIVKQMDYGETIVINTKIGQRNVVGITDGDELNYYQYRDIDSTWLQLKTGKNDISYSADEGYDLLDVEIEYTQAYINVKEI